jgi:hypothetical protein
MTTFLYVDQYLAERGAAYGISGQDMLAKTPEAIKDGPDKILEFWQNKHISHVLPVSDYPELSDEPSNLFSEDASENFSEDSDPRSHAKALNAYSDNVSDMFDGDYDDDGVVDLLT